MTTATMPASTADATTMTAATVTTNPLYLQQDNGACYVYLDGGLRHIPNPATLTALFSSQQINSSRITFPNASAAPHPILNDFPIMNGAQLVDTSNPSDGILLTDQYPWDTATTVIRHVINPNQMTELGFDWGKVNAYQGKPTFGVPLAVHTNTNFNAIKNLAGYYAVYNYLIIKGTMNPYFNYLLAQFPNPHKDNYKAQLKSLIGYWQSVVNSLPNS